MEILWTALAICTIVCFVLYSLAAHWHGLLRQQSWLLRRLADRVQVLEELGDPQFRRRLGESAPVPLDQVFTLSFRLNDHFWRDTLGLGEQDREYVRRFGSIVGSVKLECWRSHMVVTITEVLPESKTAGWQTRSLDFYPDPTSRTDALTLWELRLAPPDGSFLKPPSLDLILTKDEVQLRGHWIGTCASGIPTADNASTHPGDNQHTDSCEVTCFRVPLHAALLARFRSHDPADPPTNGNGTAGAGENGATIDGSAWQALYLHRDEKLGFEWQLLVRDLSKKAEWERWRVLESTAIRYASTEG